MSGVTTINSLGKTLYKDLNTVFVHFQHKLSIDHKVVLKQLIEDTCNEKYPSVSLMTVNGTSFESISSVTFIVSFITLFLIMFDFLHKVFQAFFYEIEPLNVLDMTTTQKVYS